MDNYEILIGVENDLKTINVLLDKEKMFNFVFNVNDDYQNSMITMRFYDNKGHEHYIIKEICIVRNDYMVYSFIQDLSYIVFDLIKKFKHKEFSNYPRDILEKWAKSMDMLSRVSTLNDKSLPREKLFELIFADFLLGKITDSISFNYLLLNGKDFITFNSINMDSLFYIRHKENENYRLEYDNFYFNFNWEQSFKDLIESFSKKDILLFKKVLNETILKAKKNESRDVFINELLLEL